MVRPTLPARYLQRRLWPHRKDDILSIKVTLMLFDLVSHRTRGLDLEFAGRLIAIALCLGQLA